jgi:cobalt-zinc-cadmium efflux system protein
MLCGPADLDCPDVLEAMRGVDGLHDVHHIHLWQIQEQKAALDYHVVLKAEA